MDDEEKKLSKEIEDRLNDVREKPEDQDLLSLETVRAIFGLNHLEDKDTKGGPE